MGASAVLTTSDEGQIAHVIIQHRPLDALLAFSNELGPRMAGRIDRDWVLPRLIAQTGTVSTARF